MRKLLTSIKNKLSLIVIVILATAVGGLATTLVQAAIPDSDGVIHGCRLTADGSVRIIDNSTTSCTGSETSLNWDQHATQGTKYGDYIPSAFANSNAEGTDVSFRNLPNTDFTNTDFGAAHLTGSNFSNSNFTGASLHTSSSGVNFTGSTFSGADMSSGNLDSSNFTNADLSDLTIDTSGFPGSNFSDANLTNSSFTNVNFNDATGMDSATLSGVSWSNVYCPDETNSDDHGNTCIGHLTPP